MKIIMLLDNPLKSDARVEKEAQILSNNGHSVLIIAQADSSLPTSENKPFGAIQRTISPSIDHPFSKAYKTFKSNFIQELAQSEFDVLHCHDYKMLLLGVEVKKLKPKLKLVYDAHEFLHGWPLYKEIKGKINQLKGKIVWHWFVRQEHKAINFADEVITVSHSIALEMQKVHHLKKIPTVLRNIPETGVILTDKYFHHKFKLHPSARVIIHSGNLYHSDARVKMMIETISSIDNVYLIFIGNSQKIKELEKNNQNPHVLFHDFIERLELYKIISTADFGIVHTWQPTWKSHWLSLPNRIMEYTLAGIPIIATKQPEFIKMGDEFNHISFYHGNHPEELKSAILKGIANFDTLKTNAVLAREKLSWEKESEKLTQLYKQL